MPIPEPQMMNFRLECAKCKASMMLENCLYDPTRSEIDQLSPEELKALNWRKVGTAEESYLLCPRCGGHPSEQTPVGTFDASRACRKCNSVGADITYNPGSDTMVRTCKVCRFIWQEWPLDKVIEPVSAIKAGG